jgi:hypothetical protein
VSVLDEVPRRIARLGHAVADLAAREAVVGPPAVVHAATRRWVGRAARAAFLLLIGSRIVRPARWSNRSTAEKNPRNGKGDSRACHELPDSRNRSVDRCRANSTRSDAWSAILLSAVAHRGANRSAAPTTSDAASQWRSFAHRTNLAVVRRLAVLILFVLLPTALGPAMGTLTRVVGELDHKCMCGMKPGTCGCPECERLERARTHVPAYPVIKGECDGAGQAVPSVAPLAIAPASITVRATAVVAHVSPLVPPRIHSADLREPPTPPPRVASSLS